MNEKIPYTPFATCLSGSAKETELRLRNIFSGPKKRPPVLFLALMFSMCILCGNLVSCQNAGAEVPDIPDSSTSIPESPDAPDSSISVPESPDDSDLLVNVTIFDAAPDLNRNGIPEELRLYVPAQWDTGQRLEVWEDGRCLWTAEGYEAHAGWNAIFLCTLDGEDCLLRYNPWMGQGFAGYGYELFTLEGGAENVVRENSVDFDINFEMPTPDGGVRDPREFFDPEAIAAFMDEVNGLLAHSVQLLNTDQDLLETFRREGRLEDTLWFLKGWEPVFTRDPEKSLLENLRDFRDLVGRYMTEGREDPG